MTMRLDGTLSLVTGGSSGIGAATARLLADEGSRVVLLARSALRLDQVARQICERGGQADTRCVDLAAERAVTAVAREVVACHGVPDILVNAAGAGRWLSVVETLPTEAAAMMAVPYLAAFNLTSELLPGMVARGSGRIVNVTSVAARLAWPGAAAYTAARRAMDGFSASVSADLFGTGVGVTTAIFGTVESPYWEHNPGSRERLPLRSARRRPLTVEQAGRAIVLAIRNDRREIVRPSGFRLLFLLNALFPGRMERALCGSPLPRAGDGVRPVVAMSRSAHHRRGHHGSPETV